MYGFGKLAWYFTEAYGGEGFSFDVYGRIQ